MDLLDYTVHREEQGNDQPLQHQQDEQDLHRHPDHQQVGEEEKIKLEDKAALREDPMFN